MTVFWLSVIFLASFFFLARSSTSLVRVLSGLARILGMSEYLVAFLLMSFATSISELFVGVSSAINGVAGISLGNVLGANLLNLTVVIGISSLVNGGLEVESKISRTNFLLIFLLSLFPLLLGADGIISRADGAILILAFVVYIWHVLGEREYFTKIVNHKPKGMEAVYKTARGFIVFFVAVVMLLISSAVLVWSGSKIASAMSFTLFSFGAVFVSLGTSLPELVFGIRSTTRGHGSMAVGNSLGSVAFNSAFIVGVVSLINPIIISGLNQFFFVAGAFVAAFIMFNVFVYSRTFISHREGILLLAAYGVFLVLEFWFKNGL